MEQQTAERLPPALEAVRQQIEEWRRTREKRTRMPEELWQAAVALVDEHGMWRVTLSDVAAHRLGKMLDKQKNTGAPFPYLRNTNVHWFRFELGNMKEMLFELEELDEFEVRPGDVLICEGGHGIGRTAVWEGALERVMFQKALHRVRSLPCLDANFLSYCIRVYDLTGVLQGYFTGAGIPHLTGKSLHKITFPLPPVAEQARIVQQVRRLMSLCEELESSLARQEQIASRLADSIVQALAEQADGEPKPLAVANRT